MVLPPAAAAAAVAVVAAAAAAPHVEVAQLPLVEAGAALAAAEGLHQSHRVLAAASSGPVTRMLHSINGSIL